MFPLNKLFVATLVASLSIISCKIDVIEVTDVETNLVDPNPAEIAVSTQLKYTKSDSGDAIYTYKCTVGTYCSNRLACNDRNFTSWRTARNIQSKLRCPKSGSGSTLSYVEIFYSVSSPSVNCYVNEGAIGLGYIGVTINAWNTLIFNYTANFYAY